MDKNFLTYISEAIDQYRTDKRQKQAAQGHWVCHKPTF